jgi:hypothetical protein
VQRYQDLIFALAVAHETETEAANAS